MIKINPEKAHTKFKFWALFLVFIVTLIVVIIPIIKAQYNMQSNVIPFAECNRRSTTPMWSELCLRNSGLAKIFENCALAYRGAANTRSFISDIIDEVSFENTIPQCTVPKNLATPQELEATKQAYRICLSNTIRGVISFHIDTNHNLIVYSSDALINDTVLQFYMAPTEIELINDTRVKYNIRGLAIPKINITNTTNFRFSDKYGGSENLNVVFDNPSHYVVINENEICGNNFIIEGLRCKGVGNEGCVIFYNKELSIILPNTTVENYLSILGPITFGPFNEPFNVGQNLLGSQKIGNSINFVKKENIPIIQINNKDYLGLATVIIGKLNIISQGQVVGVTKEDKLLKPQEISLEGEYFLIEKYLFNKKLGKNILVKSYLIQPEKGFSTLYKEGGNFKVKVPDDYKGLKKIVESYYR
ncbi:MAG: hypothetical protein ACPLXC_00605 [Candidatus Pacearchaeota archaeon]